MAAELSVIYAKKPMSSTSISKLYSVKVLSRFDRILARVGNRSSPMSIKIIALNLGIAAKALRPLTACNTIFSF